MNPTSKLLIVILITLTAPISKASTFAERREKFNTEMQDNLNTLEKEIAEVKSKITKSTDETKKSLNNELDQLETKRLELKSDLQKTSDKSEKAWEEMKSGFSKAWSELHQSFKKAKQKLK